MWSGFEHEVMNCEAVAQYLNTLGHIYVIKQHANIPIMNIPNITVKYGKLIDPYLKDWVKERYPDYNFPTREEISKKIKLFRKVVEDNKHLIEKICQFTNLDFKRNQIDVFIVSAINRDMSAPLIIRSRWDKEKFLEVFIHEIIHVLFADNCFVPAGEESSTIRNHVAVFYVMRHLGFELEPKDPEYVKAWELSREYKFK